MENFRFWMTKVYSEIPHPLWKTSDLGWPKFTPKYPPPIIENFRFGMTKVYSEIPPPHYGKLQIWDDQSLLRNTPPPPMENFRFGMTKVYSEIPPPIMENFRFGMTKVYSEIPPPPPMENFRFGMAKVYSGITPPPIMENFKIWDDQRVYSEIPPLLENFQIWDDRKFTPKYPPPIMENFRFGMTKVYSGIPPPPNQPKIVREFKSKIFRILRVTTCVRTLSNPLLVNLVKKNGWEIDWMLVLTDRCVPYCYNLRNLFQWHKIDQGSHSDWKNWKTWKNGKAFSSQGKVREFEQTGKVREKSGKTTQNTGKLRKFQKKIICYFSMIFKWTVYYLLKCIKFSVKK